MIRVGEVLLQN